MTISFDQFVDEAMEILNINLRGYKIKRVQRRTDSLMRRYNVEDYGQCLELLKKDQDFRNAYLDHFTINTSEFYRNPQSFQYLEEKIIPVLFSQNKVVNIWSAPCSNGAEPYTLAIMLTELGYTKSQYRILASDIDAGILEDAGKAIYNENAVTNVPPALLGKYFEEIEGLSTKYKLSSEIIKKVTFEEKDLINDPYEKGWDLILSRNFFIYLTTEIKEMLTYKFVEALRPGGFLFLGNTEFIFSPEKFGLQKLYSSFYKKI